MTKNDIEFKSNNSPSPFQEWLNAHMQCLESLKYLKPDDFVKNPEKLIEKQLSCILSNSVALQEYLKKSWSIMGKIFTQTSPSTKCSIDNNISAQNFSPFIPDDMLGRISNSIFTPTYMGLNPFDLAKSFATDLTSDLVSKNSKISGISRSKAGRSKKNAKI